MRPSIWKPPHTPRTTGGEAVRRRACIASSSPLSRTHSRSATVDLVPGSTIRSGSPNVEGWSTKRTATPPSTRRGSKSVKFDSRGSRSTTTSSCAAPGAGGSTGPSRRQPVQGVLGIEDQPGHEGQHAQGGHAAAGFELLHGVAEQEGIPPEHVDDEASDAPAELLGQDGHGAVEMGEDAAPVDVADHDRRDPGPAGEAQVHYVVVEQVDLGRAPAPSQITTSNRRRRSARAPIDDLDQVGLGRAGSPPPAGSRGGVP